MMMNDARMLGSGIHYKFSESVPYTKYRKLKLTHILRSDTLCVHLKTTENLVMEGS